MDGGSQPTDPNTYLIVTERLYDLRNVEQDGVLRADVLLGKLTKQHGEEEEPCELMAYWREGAQHLDAVLSSERMRRVHAAEVRQAGRWVCWSPTQDVAQLWRVGIDGVPRHQELVEKKRLLTSKLPAQSFTPLTVLTLTASGTSLTAPGSSLTSLVTSATMASFLNLKKQVNHLLRFCFWYHNTGRTGK